MVNDNQKHPLLFNDSETFQKERPKKATAKQIEDFYIKMANEIQDENYSSSDEDDIIHDLKKLYPFTDSGFEMAKELDGYSADADYDIDADFIQWLEDLRWKFIKLNEVNVKTWVKAHNPKPQFKKGTHLIINEKLCYGKIKGVSVYVNGFNEDTACYLVDEDIKRNGGTVLPYELVEKKCSVIEKEATP